MAPKDDCTDKIAQLLHMLRRHFCLDTFETVKMAEKVYPEVNWKGKLDELRKKDEELLRAIFGLAPGEEIDG